METSPFVVYLISLSSRLYTILMAKFLLDSNSKLCKEAAQARLSLHLSKLLEITCRGSILICTACTTKKKNNNTKQKALFGKKVACNSLDIIYRQ